METVPVLKVRLFSFVNSHEGAVFESYSMMMMRFRLICVKSTKFISRAQDVAFIRRPYVLKVDNSR